MARRKNLSLPAALLPRGDGNEDDRRTPTCADRLHMASSCPYVHPPLAAIPSRLSQVAALSARLRASSALSAGTATPAEEVASEDDPPARTEMEAAVEAAKCLVGVLSRGRYFERARGGQAGLEAAAAEGVSWGDGRECAQCDTGERGTERVLT